MSLRKALVLTSYLNLAAVSDVLWSTQSDTSRHPTIPLLLELTIKKQSISGDGDVKWHELAALARCVPGPEPLQHTVCL